MRMGESDCGAPSRTASCESGWCRRARSGTPSSADHHPGYITLERWEANQARLRANVLTAGGYGSPGAPREGRALLQGLVRCGRCARKLEVSYSGRSLTPRYRCTKAQAMYGAAICQSIGGHWLEKLVLDQVFAALAPAAIDATLRAMAQLTDTHQAQCARRS